MQPSGICIASHRIALQDTTRQQDNKKKKKYDRGGDLTEPEPAGDGVCVVQDDLVLLVRQYVHADHRGEVGVHGRVDAVELVDEGVLDGVYTDRQTDINSTLQHTHIHTHTTHGHARPAAISPATIRPAL